MARDADVGEGSRLKRALLWLGCWLMLPLKGCVEAQRDNDDHLEKRNKARW